MVDKPIRATVLGAAGRMGRMLIANVAADSELVLSGAVDRPDAPEIGQDSGVLAGIKPNGVPVAADLAGIIGDTDVLIEFSTPEATMAHAEAAGEYRKPMVIGTTGLSPAQLARLGAIAQTTPIFTAPNMGLGINLLLKALPLVAKALGSDYDIEVTETHHHHKMDAPSGTAIKLAEVIAHAQGTRLEDRAVYGRHGVQPRKQGEIGIHALRAGSVVGDHTVLFANEGEQIEISHRAYSRQPFALGALRAAKWIARQEPGLYSMQDLLA